MPIFHNDPDDHPDYFLADEQEAAAGAATADRTIDFTADGTDHDTTGSSENPEPKKRHSRFHKVIGWTIAIAVIVLGVAFYLRYCSPYAVDAVERVYVVNVDKRGLVFKTYEAQVLPLNSLADTSSVYSQPEQFTVASPELALKLQQLQGTRTPVVLHYEKFYATLPWRGASKFVITSVTNDL